MIFDPSWSPAADLQAQDRAFRMGQAREVTVYRLISTGTIEVRQLLAARSCLPAQRAVRASTLRAQPCQRIRAPQGSWLAKLSWHPSAEPGISVQERIYMRQASPRMLIACSFTSTHGSSLKQWSVCCRCTSSRSQLSSSTTSTRSATSQARSIPWLLHTLLLLF